MSTIPRTLLPIIQAALGRGKSILLLGPRQTGKTTLTKQLNPTLTYNFILPKVRQRFEREPDLLLGEVEALAESHPKPLVVLDEVQKVPACMDVVQDLIDRKIAQFILTGSSARKLKKVSQTNWLPGRVLYLRLDPLTWPELAPLAPTLDDLLYDGSLPGIITQTNQNDRALDLNSYAVTYLEEEIRKEAVVRDVGFFAQFLLLAARESGRIVNFRKISQAIGVAHTTITAYYQILEDCMIAERIFSFLKGSRQRLSHNPKFLFFDLGVRRLASGEGRPLPETYMGYLFEQWVGLELIRLVRQGVQFWNLCYWHSHDGPEIDWVLTRGDMVVPIECKWTSSPRQNDIKSMRFFMDKYREVRSGYLVCRVPRKAKLDTHIYAVPWQEISEILQAESKPI